MIVSVCMEMLRKVVGVITLVVVLVFFWFAYSLIRFDGFFHPLYTIGLSDPYGYYQQHVGSMLTSAGEEYQIQDIDTSEWYVYRDSQKRFEFKLPYFKVEDIRYTDQETRRLQLHSGIYPNEDCEIYLEFNTRGVGTRWLPRMRRSVEYSLWMNRKSELHFIRDQYGGAIQIRSTRFGDVEQGDSEGAGITFIRQERDQFVEILDHGNTCDEAVMKGMLATFRFVD